MPKASRDKGARGEREIIDLLQPIVDAAYKDAGREPPQLKRASSMQADGGGCDVYGIDWLALEVKRCETLQLEAWWRQCMSQAQPDKQPVLIYRQNGRQWRVRLWLHDVVVTTVADIAVVDFLRYFAEALKRQLAWEMLNWIQ
jgi:hypothetical protein